MIAKQKQVLSAISILFASTLALIILNKEVKHEVCMKGSRHNIGIEQDKPCPDGYLVRSKKCKG